jgi:hypothetical protein
MISKKLKKKIYDKNRRNKIKDDKWKFNKKMPSSLSMEQEEVLIGGLLGDTYLYSYENHKNAGISIARSIKDYDYLEWQYNLYIDFCSKGIRKFFSSFRGKGKKTEQCSFRTRVSNLFTPFRKKWYPSGIKIVPKDLILTPLIVAIWFCDDGSITYSGKKSRRVAFYTDGFTKNEVEFLANLLSDTLGIKIKITRKKNAKINYGYYLYTCNKKDIKKFVNYIKDIFPVSMKRKSERWENFI